MYVHVQVHACRHELFWFAGGASFLFSPFIIDNSCGSRTADAKGYVSQVATVTVKGEVLQYDHERLKWVIIGGHVTVGSGFALDRLGSSFVVTAGHCLQDCNLALRRYWTATEALVTPASRFRTVPGEDRREWDTARELGGIPVDDYKTLYEPTVRKKLRQQLFGIRRPGDEIATECDLAVLHLRQPLLPQEETLRVETDEIKGIPDSELRVGLVLGCPGMSPWSPEALVRCQHTAFCAL